MVQAGNLSTVNSMKRLSLEELKAKTNVVANLEAIKGGTTDGCHCQDCSRNVMVKDGVSVARRGSSI
jgi:DNA-directed RNA polymerase subunit RPC12/RpoP